MQLQRTSLSEPAERDSAVSSFLHPTAARPTDARCAAHPYSPFHFAQRRQARSRNKALSDALATSCQSSCPQLPEAKGLGAKAKLSKALPPQHPLLSLDRNQRARYDSGYQPCRLRSCGVPASGCGRRGAQRGPRPSPRRGGAPRGSPGAGFGRSDPRGGPAGPARSPRPRISPHPAAGGAESGSIW